MATTLNPSEISELIKSRIENFKLHRRSAQRRHAHLACPTASCAFTA